MSKNQTRIGHAWGVHRVLDLKPRLVQAAEQVNAHLPIDSHEMLIAVDYLQIDSASFRQLSEQYPADADLQKAILDIVKRRGKMQNPVTGSGGMLLGRVQQIGVDYHSITKVQEGDKIATLISLTATPLQIDHIKNIERAKERVQVEGHAILFEKSIFAKMPNDIDEGVALAAFDICGAPLLVKQNVRQGDTILLLGLGKAGKSILAMLDLEFNNQIQILGLDPFEPAVSFCQQNFPGKFAQMDASQVLQVRDWVQNQTQDLGADFVVNAANVPDTEMSAILSTKQKGRCLFFGMATDFQKATLGAEAVGQDIILQMGSGYVEGHAEYMLSLLRKSQSLMRYFKNHYS